MPRRCCRPRRGSRRSAARTSNIQLKTQILPDGGHASRCPDVLPGLLADLLPLAQCYVSASKPVPQELVRAVDRMFPALRFFRHSDGHIAMFHGAGSNNFYLTAAVLRHDQNGAQPLGHMPHSGYQRLAPAAPSSDRRYRFRPPAHGFTGHASCLAFELSSGRQRLIVNSGVDRPAPRSLPRNGADDGGAFDAGARRHVDGALRRFGRAWRDKRSRIVSGPSTVRIERRTTASRAGLRRPA
jgi:uncharacterized heparinase superfamily protein